MGGHITPSTPRNPPQQPQHTQGNCTKLQSTSSTPAPRSLLTLLYSGLLATLLTQTAQQQPTAPTLMPVSKESSFEFKYAVGPNNHGYKQLTLQSEASRHIIDVEATPFHQVFFYSQSDPPKILLFHPTEVRHSSMSPTEQTPRSFTAVSLADPLTIYFADTMNSKIYSYKIEIWAGVNVVKYFGVIDVVNEVLASLGADSLSTAYFLSRKTGSPNECNMARTDSNFNETIEGLFVTATLVQPQIFFFQADFIFVGGEHMEFPIFKRDTLELQSMIADPAHPNTGFFCPQIGVDSMNSSLFYMAVESTTPGNPVTLKLIDLEASTSSSFSILKVLGGLATGMQRNKILNFGPYQYLGIVDKQKLVLVSKSSFLMATELAIDLAVAYSAVGSAFQANNATIGYLAVNSTDTTMSILRTISVTFDKCAKPTPDPNICSECGQGLYKVSSPAQVTCVDPATYPMTGVGPDLTSSMIRTCESGGCRNCSRNYQSCTECDQANGYILLNAKCFRKFGIQKTYFRSDDYAAAVDFTSNLDPLTIKPAAFEVVVIDVTSETNFTCVAPTCEVTVRPEGLLISLSPNTTLMKTVLSVTYTPPSNAAHPYLQAADATHVFEGWPLAINNIIFLPKKSKTLLFVKICGYFLRALRMLSFILLMPVNAIAATCYDVLLSELQLYYYIIGPLVSKPQLFLKGAAGVGLLPVSVGNPFGTWAAKTTCQTQGAFLEQNTECNILSNYGEDLVVIGAIICINLLVWFVSRQRLRSLQHHEYVSVNKPKSVQSDKPTTPSSVVNDQEDSSVDDSKIELGANDAKTDSKAENPNQLIFWKTVNKYGMRCFLATMFGLKLRLLIFAFLHIGTMPGGSAGVIGLIISMLLVAFYCILGYLFVLLARRVRDRVTFKPKRWNSQMWFIRPNWIMDDELRYIHTGFVTPICFFYEQSFLPGSSWDLLYPFIDILRAFFVAIAICYFNDDSVQLSLLFVSEMLMLLYSLKSNIKVNRLCRVWEYLRRVCAISFVCFKIITAQGLSEDTLQLMIGVCMLVTVGLQSLMTLIYSLAEIWKVLVSLKNWLKSLSRIEPKDKSATVPVKESPPRPKILPVLTTQPQGTNLINVHMKKDLEFLSRSNQNLRVHLSQPNLGKMGGLQSSAPSSEVELNEAANKDHSSLAESLKGKITELELPKISGTNIRRLPVEKPTSLIRNPRNLQPSKPIASPKQNRSYRSMVPDSVQRGPRQEDSLLFPPYEAVQTAHIQSLQNSQPTSQLTSTRPGRVILRPERDHKQRSMTPQHHPQMQLESWD